MGVELSTPIGRYWDGDVKRRIKGDYDDQAGGDPLGLIDEGVLLSKGRMRRTALSSVNV
jgi:hypothetical protein